MPDQDQPPITQHLARLQSHPPGGSHLALVPSEDFWRTQGNDHEVELAQEAIERHHAGQTLTTEHQFALEAIVFPSFRPVIDVKNDSFLENELPPDWGLLKNYRELIESTTRAVGRIDLPGHARTPYAGTGFLVGPDLLLTNRHVARVFVEKSSLRFRSGLQPVTDFKHELGSTETRILSIKEPAVWISEDWDAALLRVDGAEELKHLTLCGTEPDYGENISGERANDIVVIGYPFFSTTDHATLQERIFRGVYGAKRLQPGRLMGYQSVSSGGKMVEALTHDASTLGGNSGSAVVDLKSGKVFGLHFAGKYLSANFSVPAWDLATQSALIDAGASIE